MLSIRHELGMNHADRSRFAREVLSSLMTLSTLLILLRIYARYILIKSPGLDDAIACVAYIFVMAQGILEIIEVQHGEGRQVTTVPKEDLRVLHVILPTQIFLYFITVGLTRLSIVACLPRLHKNATFKRFAYLLGAFIITVTLVFLFVFVFQCNPPIQVWHPRPPAERKCMRPGAEMEIMIAHGIIGVILDFILLAIPLYLIYTKMIWSTQALKVMLVISVGQLAFAMGIVRLIFLFHTDPFVNMTYHMVPGTLSAHAEVHVILWVACFHTLPPVIRLIARKTGLRSTTSRSTSTPKGSSKLLSKLCVTPASRRKTWLPIQTHSVVTTHIVSTNRMSRVEQEEIELETPFGKDVIVKSTHVEMHTSPRRSYEAERPEL